MRIVPKPEEFRAFIKSVGNNRNEAARRIGVSPATAYRIELEQVDPSPKFIAGLIIATGRTFEDLFEIQEAA